MLWDLFCKVIDNHGDLGVCWRLAVDLATTGDRVRLWVDDAGMLAWMAPHGHEGVEVLAWSASAAAQPGDAVIEAFGCDPDPAFVAAMAARKRTTGQQPAWLNLEYLSAESWVERCHGLPSPVLSGPGEGLAKYFFYPGFTPRTGGLLREPDLLDRQSAFDKRAWLARHGVPWQGERLVSLFCYEPPGLAALLAALAGDAERTRVLVTPGRATAAVRGLLAAGFAPGALGFDWLPAVPQADFDGLLWSSDLNCVRGEDSMVRALWAGKPLLWNIYPQSDGAHGPKLQAFLDWLDAPASLRQLHLAYNGLASPAITLDLPAWRGTVRGGRARLLAQPDLVSQLKSFAGTVHTTIAPLATGP